MSQPTLETLARQAAAGDPTASDMFFDRLLALLRSCDPAMLDRVASCALAVRGQRPVAATPSDEPSLPPRAVPLTAELIAWAREQFTEEELAAGLRELRAGGGVESEALLRDVDAEVGQS